ncbi:hypothetical protein BGZ80_010075 [Entomortierella chlamydospora]|uniref:Uncharacterized protein n=1 Tax=Entomortierella chlamydospora TaxID=101097 RepID=A0A9P6T0A1_9FUNG|nr:hypothetical protein BGZ79_008376 [Entomortierella chlamydospora]KAG0015050.1 hypothetical protein BGZ80_010075 [Entomortierella chlamydospora]
MKFGLPFPEKCEFTFRARGLPYSPSNRTFAIPKLLAAIVKSIADSYINLESAQGSIRDLRLVSRDFHQAADPYFAVYLECANYKRLRYETDAEYNQRICGKKGYYDLDEDEYDCQDRVRPSY